jgi:hypothetical protein
MTKMPNKKAGDNIRNTDAVIPMRRIDVPGPDTYNRQVKRQTPQRQQTVIPL